jgi:hypothetical protein
MIRDGQYAIDPASTFMKLSANLLQHRFHLRRPGLSVGQFLDKA